MSLESFEKRRFWRELVYFPVIFNIIGLLALGLLFILASGHAVDSVTVNTVALLSVVIIEWFFAVIIVRRLRKEDVSLKRFLVPRKKTDFVSAVFVFVALTAIFISYMIAALAFGRIPRMGDLNLLQLVFFLVLVPVTAGFSEELVWRGYFMEKLLTYYASKWKSIVFTSVSFAFIHGFFLPDKLVVTFLFGLVAGLYYFRERNLVVLITAHAVIDVVAYALTVFA